MTLGARLPWRGTLYSSGESFLPAGFCVASKKHLVCMRLKRVDIVFSNDRNKKGPTFVEPFY